MISKDLNYKILPLTETTRSVLEGSFQVILGPKGGCDGGKPYSQPTLQAHIRNINGNLVATNECGTTTSLSIDRNVLYIWNEYADVRFIGSEDVTIKFDDGNSWRKVK
jgi:hypothetical protein